MSLLPALAAVAGILALAGAAGLSATPALFPDRSARLAERLAWGLALGLLLLAGLVPLVLRLRTSARLDPVSRSVGPPRGRVAPPFEAGAGERIAPAPPAESGPKNGRATALLAALLALGVLLYLLRALTEPMWATDFLAIWGWKGKTIFGAGAFPAATFLRPELGFTHPEYPLGLPFLYASLGFLLGGWDDHATGLLFPACQAGTLLFIAGWLRRRGAPAPLPLAAAAALSLFEPLYRAFTTGMADVPLSLFLLLLGASLADALDGEPGGLRRLAVAAFAAAAIKNEGLFAAAAAAGIALLSTGAAWPRRRRALAAAALPALLALALHRLATGPQPLRDFDFRLLFSREFPIRLGFDVRAIALEVGAIGALGLGAFLLLLAAGRRTPSSDRLLALAALLLAAYAVLPAFCVLGPEWLVRTAFARTAAALAPLLFAAAALRLSLVFRL